MNTHTFELQFKKVDSALPKFAQRMTYEMVVKDFCILLSVAKEDIKQIDWSDPEGQAITWSGTKEECEGHQRKMLEFGHKHWVKIKQNALSWIARVPSRSVQRAINKRIEELEREEGGYFTKVQGILLYFGVTLTPLVVKIPEVNKI